MAIAVLNMREARRRLQAVSSYTAFQSERPACAHGVVQLIEHRARSRIIDACIRDAHAVLQVLGARRGDVLSGAFDIIEGKSRLSSEKTLLNKKQNETKNSPSRIDMTLDHHARDMPCRRVGVGRGELLGDGLDHERLVVVVFERVAVCFFKRCVSKCVRVLVSF